MPKIEPSAGKRSVPLLTNPRKYVMIKQIQKIRKVRRTFPMKKEYESPVLSWVMTGDLDLICASDDEKWTKLY
jgi:hypothetical protein